MPLLLLLLKLGEANNAGSRMAEGATSDATATHQRTSTDNNNSSSSERYKSSTSQPHSNHTAPTPASAAADDDDVEVVSTDSLIGMLAVIAFVISYGAGLNG